MLSEHKGELAFIGFAMVAYLVMASLDVSQNYVYLACLLYTSPSPRDKRQSRMPSSA